MNREFIYQVIFLILVGVLAAGCVHWVQEVSRLITK